MSVLLKKFTCIVCPQSCNLSVWQNEKGEIQVTGNKCQRGLVHGKQEFVNPIRILTSTIKAVGGDRPLLPIRSSKGMPLKYFTAVMEVINRQAVRAPVKIGQIVIKNPCGLKDIDIIASSDLNSVKTQ
jgi:CxxC motif-containing protein